LNELFHDEEITNAINGKIDKVFLFDKPNQDEVGFNADEKNEADKAFFTCEQADFGDEITMHRMPNKDILSLANKYFYDSHSIRIAVPVMKHPTAKDGNGMDSGARSMEEILAMKSGYFFPAYLNKNYNKELRDPEVINFGKFCGNQKSSALIGALPTTTSNSDFEDKALQGAVIGGFIGAGLFTTAVACGIVVAPVAVVSVVAVGIVVSSAGAGAILYPKITQLWDQKKQGEIARN
jgi:hypothetical protein